MPARLLSNFRAMFPFWALAQGHASPPMGPGVTPYAAMVAVVVGVLVLGVVLLMRDVSGASARLAACAPTWSMVSHTTSRRR